MKKVDTFIEEQSALVDKKTLYEIYRLATEESYSFLFVKLREREWCKQNIYGTGKVGEIHSYKSIIFFKA